MKTKNKLSKTIIVLLTGLCVACGNQGTGQRQSGENTSMSAERQEAPAATSSEPAKPSTSKGVGPISNYQPGEINETQAKAGETLFTTKCSMCHRLDSKLVGPPLKGVTKRHTPEWVLNMMLDPEKMIAEDAEAKALFEQYGSPMINLQLTEDNAKAIYDYLRKTDKE